MDILTEDALGGSSHGVPVFRKDRHLSSALLITEIEYVMCYKNEPRALKREHRMLIEDMNKRKASLTHPEEFYAWCMQKILGSDPVDTKNVAECHSLLRMSDKAFRLAHFDWTRIHPQARTPQLPDIITRVYDRKSKMDDVFDVITYDTEFKRTWKMCGIKGTAYGNLHLVEHKPGAVFVITHAHLAGVRDMIASWFDVLMYSLLAKDKYPGVDLYTEVCHLITSCVDYAKRYPVYVYDLMKMWPSLCIGSILRDLEDYNTFYNALRPDIPHREHPLVRWMVRRVENDAQVHARLELSGLGKMFGHPIVDMERSINTWIEKGTVMKIGKEEMGKRCSEMFKLVMCRRYYEERNRWPSLTFNGQESPVIRASYTRGMWTETPAHPWKSEYFRGVEFEHTFEFNMYVDPSDLLSDKSIIPTREHWPYEFDGQAHRTLYGRFPTRPHYASKSVIISYLSQEEVNVGDIINTINLGRVPMSWRVIVAVAKEREHKRTNARFYAKITPEMKLYQIATEGNIADIIFRYIREQSMAMGEEQLLRTITRMTSPHTDPTKSKYKFIVIDFSSWCTNFRWEFSQSVFRDLDNLFGFQMVYQYTHLFHLSAILMFQDRFGPPQQGVNGDPVPSKRCAYGPEAWQEGLRQKGWTLITIMLIQLAAETCNTTASLLGQGDNQVVLLKIPSEATLFRLGVSEEVYVNNFVTVLTNYAENAGIPVKPLETWQSHHLFEYSRKYHHKGAQVSSALKKISRLRAKLIK